MSVPTGVLTEAVSTEQRQWEKHGKGREREIESVGLTPDVQEGKGTKDEAMKRPGGE